ncbi:MAG TPA: aldehyde dehydrogenase family protein, partial [Saprospiraceae bacterium]|nr:aldehyde dehydrogenase family protein [Saprospiraceae bacterium]
MDKILHFIDGQYSPSASDRWMDKINPATGEKTADIALGDQTDIQRAVDASAKALTSWSSTSAQQRFEILNSISELINERAELLAMAETNDTGKPLRLSREVEIPRASSNFRFFATAALQFSSESHAMHSAINYTLRQPVGIVGCISPWNLPLAIFTGEV